MKERRQLSPELNDIKTCLEHKYDFCKEKELTTSQHPKTSYEDGKDFVNETAPP